MLISKSMEKTFRRLNNRDVRKAFVESELANGLAHQIRVLRRQHGWSQQDLATKLGTSQTAVSRLEDPSYGKFSVKSLLALGDAFDVALYVRFLPFSQFLTQTWDTSEHRFLAESYTEESDAVCFFTESASTSYLKTLDNTAENSSYRVVTSSRSDAPVEQVISDHASSANTFLKYFIE